MENFECRRVLAGDPPTVLAMSQPDSEGQIAVVFSKPVLNVDNTDFQLLRNGQPVGSPQLSVQPISESNYRVQLPSLADSVYALQLMAAASDIHDVDGNLLANDGSAQWTVEQALPSWQVEFAPATPVTPALQRVASMGDSMTLESGGSYVQFVRNEFASDLYVNDVFAGSGWKAETLRSVWETQVRDAGYSAVILFSGLPNLTSTNSSAAEIFTHLQTIYDDAGARGIQVVAVSVLPWSQYRKWTAQRQEQTELLNAMIRDYAASHSEFMRYVNGYDQFGMLDDSQRLSPRFDSGDGAHLSTPGERKLAGLITSALTSFDASSTVNQSARIHFSEPVTGVAESQISLSTPDGPLNFQLTVESSETARIDFQVPSRAVSRVQLNIATSLDGIVDQAGKLLQTQPAADFVIDCESPIAAVATDQSRVSETAVQYVTVQFSEPVIGLTAENFGLTRNRVGIDLTGMSIESIDARTYRLNLGPFVQQDGNYRLVLQARTSIVDTSGNPMLRGSQIHWVTLPAAPRLTSGTLYLSGTQDNDTLELIVSPTDIQLAIDGEVVTFSRQGVQAIELAAGNGIDLVSERVLPGATPINVRATSTSLSSTVYLFDSLADDTYMGSPTDGTLSNNNSLNLQAIGFSRVVGISRSGNDQASMIDSSGNDQMESRGWISTLSGTGYTLMASGFATVTGQSTRGGTDTADLYDSAVDDLFTSTPNTSTMTVPGYSYSAVGFARVNSRTSTGNDRAVLQGTANVENFVGQTSSSSWSGSNFAKYLYSYDSVEVTSGGGNDRAILYDSPGNDSLEASAKSATLTMGSVRLKTLDFPRTNVYARSGNDTAWFQGSSNYETFIGQPTNSSLTAGGQATYAYAFDNVIADSGGGNDVATLYDSTGDDVMQASPNATSLTGPNYSLLVRNFRKVSAYARSGVDQAQLTGSAGNDTFTGQPTYASMLGASFSLYAYAFDRVRGASGGGTDTANLYDTTGDDTFEAWPATAKLYGGGYENTAAGFARVNAYARQGNDTAILNGSSGLESLTARPTLTSMLGTGFANYAYAFDQVTARSGGGADIAAMYDSAGDEQFIGNATSAQLIGATFVLSAENYARVNAYASSGNDRAILNGTAGNETYTGRPESSSLKGAAFLLLASGFDNVAAVGGGGSDIASLYDSAGDDQATIGHQSASLISQTSNNSVTGFARINLLATSGINAAAVSDSPGSDKFAGLDNRGTLTSVGFTCVLTDFTSISLLPSIMGTDRVTKTNLRYQLNIGAGWIV